MAELDRAALNEFVNVEIVKFHQARLAGLRRLKLEAIVKKNPYLFKAKNIQVASDLVQTIMNAFLSSSEEEMFGAFLEELAIFVSEKTCNGRKSTAPGLDLEFDRESIRYLVAIKSSTNWGNSSQYARLADNFKRAVQVQRQSHRIAHVQPVLGMCYGRAPAFVDTGVYWKMSGQRFWHFLSGDEDLYVDIVEPIGYEAKRHNDDFETSRAAIQNRLTDEFFARFCNDDFSINWEKLVAYNSGNMEQA
jgi:hypothetical protein